LSVFFIFEKNMKKGGKIVKIEKLLLTVKHKSSILP